MVLIILLTLVLLIVENLSTINENYSTDDVDLLLYNITHKLNQELVKLLPVKSRITYIPAASDTTGKYFKKFKRWFGYYGYKNFIYCDLDKEFDEARIPEVENSDAIYLSGGNTFYFLNSIKKRGFINLFKRFAQSGKLVIGLSAGAYIITSTIKFTAEYHKS